VEQKATSSGTGAAALPGLEDVIDRVMTTVYDAKPADAYQAEIARGLQRVLVSHLMNLAATSNMSQVRAIATFKLKQIQQRMNAKGALATATTADRAHAQLLASDIQRFIERPGDQATRILTLAAAPPGAPIGDAAMDYLLGLGDACAVIRH